MRKTPQVSALPKLFGLARTTEWGGNPAGLTRIENQTRGRDDGPAFVSGAPSFFLIYQYTKVSIDRGPMLNRSA
jgi:hypothetical protein